MKTIFKNELPSNFKSWLDLCDFINKRGLALNNDIVIMNQVSDCKHEPDKKYYINIDFAKARAYDEIMDSSKNISNNT